MKALAVFLVFNLFNFGTLWAQERDIRDPGAPGLRKNSVYFELLGNGAIYSINYDRIIPVKKDLNLVLRFGGNEYHGIRTEQLSFNFIGAAGVLVGSRKRFFEASLGYTHFLGGPDRLFVLTGGYRFQGHRGLVIRLTPMFIANTQTGDTFGNGLWIGFSIGYSF